MNSLEQLDYSWLVAFVVAESLQPSMVNSDHVIWGDLEQ